MILIPDQYSDKNEVVKSIKYVTFNNNGNDDVRLDRIDLRINNGKKIIERMTHFGKKCATFFDIDDFSYAVTNIDTKEVESAEMSVTNGIYGTAHIPYPVNFIGIDGEKENLPFINKAVYDITKLNGYIPRRAELVNNVSLPMNAYTFEDIMNIEYSDILGNLSAIITQSSLSVPYRADIILDSVYGVNIKNIKLIFNDTDIKDIFEEELKSLCSALNVIHRSMKKLYQKENKHIRIYSSIREFDSYIYVKDVNEKCEYKFHLNNSDHARTLYTSIAHLGEKWYDTEGFGDLIDTKCKTITSAMYGIENEDRRFTFENTDYSDNFPMSYN